MSKGKMTIQDIVEKILEKHKIDANSDEYYLKLQKPHYLDLVIEKQGPEIFVGHYVKQNGDLISDPVLLMDHNEGFWYPVRIEQVFGDTTCSFKRDGVRHINKQMIREFKSFQAMFARNIKDQDWLNNSTRFIEA